MIKGRLEFRGFDRLVDVLRKPYDGARGQLAIRRIRGVIANELGRGVTFTSGGASIPMLPTKPFGNRPATIPPLGGTRSALYSAWQGGPGGFSSASRNKATVGVSLIYAAVHRGGSVVPSNKPTRIRITPRMRGFVGANFGVHFRRDKRHITIPARPYGDARAPQYVDATRSVLVEAIVRSTE